MAAVAVSGGAPWLLVAADFVRTGGMDRANYGLAAYLASAGAEVHLVGHGIAASLLRQPGIHWHPVPRPLGHDALGWGLLARAGKRWARPLSRAAGRVVVNGGNCAWADINWVHYLHAAYAPPPDRAGAGALWQRWKHRRALADEGRALAAARLVIANSNVTRNDILRRYPLPPESIHTVYYGCESQRFAAVTNAERDAARRQLGWNPEGTTALFVGALGDQRKGFDTVFAAWERLARQPGWNMELAVVGRGRQLPAWQERAAAAACRQPIRFLGFRRDVPQLLAASDLLLAPVRYEAYGLAVQEALARGLPTLVSAGAGVAERLPAELHALRLRDPNSAEELAERVLWWRGHRDQLRAPLDRFGQQLRRWTWADMAQQIVALAQGAPAREAMR